MVLPLPLLIAKVFESCDLSPDFDLSPRKVLISGIPVSQSILLKRFSAILLQKESPGVLSGAFCSLLFHYSEMDGITRHVNVIDSMIDRCFGGLTGVFASFRGYERKSGLFTPQFAKSAELLGRDGVVFGVGEVEQ